MPKIIICNKCDGTGKVETRSGWDEYDLVKCTQCEGSGRVLETTYVSYKPYDPNKPLWQN
jgi:DnaJ-class molecular chaperone